jgi:hypothetical protein
MNHSKEGRLNFQIAGKGQECNWRTLRIRASLRTPLRSKLGERGRGRGQRGDGGGEGKG